MNTNRSVFRTVISFAAVAAAILAFIVVLRLVIGRSPGSPLTQPVQTIEVSTLPESETPPVEPGVDRPTPPYPIPEYVEPTHPTRTPLPLPTSTPTLPPYPETPPVPGVLAATLYNRDVWLVEDGRTPEKLTDFGDVAVVFGWNYDGSMLFFGRGRIEQSEFVGDTTELWLIDTRTREARQLTTDSMVKSAAWSPVDNRIAYCELGNILNVFSLSEEKRQQLKQVICTFTWSPDGTAIAFGTYTPDMVDSDGLAYTVLAVWWLADEKTQVFSDAKDEEQAWPVWSMDGRSILFLRSCYSADKEGLGGLYVADVTSGQFYRLEGTPVHPSEMVRSPRGDLVAYWDGDDSSIYVMDFEGNFNIIGQSRSFVWLPDGKTLLYRATDNNYKTVTIDVKTAESPAGGQRPTTGLYMQPQFFFAPGGQP